MPQSSYEPRDTVLSAPSSPGPSNQQTPPDNKSLPLLLPTDSTSSPNVTSPLRQLPLASQDASWTPPGAFCSPPLPISLTNGPNGSPGSTTAGTTNMNASTPPPQDQPYQLPWYPESMGGVHAGPVNSLPVPMSPPISLPPPHFLQPPFNAFTSAPPLRLAPPTPYPHSLNPLSQSHNVHPSNQISLSSATPGVGPNFLRMPAQTSSSYYPTNPVLPNSQVNQLTSSSSHHPQHDFSTSGAAIGPPNPDLPSQRPLSYAPQAPMNPEPRPARMLSAHPQPVQQKVPSRELTGAAFVANDPFSSHSRKRSNIAVKNNVTFDDIRVTPISTPEESAAQQYMTSSNSYPPASMSAPPPNAPPTVNASLPTDPPPPWPADAPFRHPSDRPWYDSHRYAADAENIYPFLIPTYSHPLHPPPTTNISQGFWSHVGGVLHGLLPKKSVSETATGAVPAIDEESQEERYSVAAVFVAETLPRQVYLHLLLRLPSLYFSRVARIFEEADLTLPEIKKMALETASHGSLDSLDGLSFEAGIAAVPPQYERLKTTWESFIDSVMREWKTFNIISVLLLSAILTILQISGAADDPVTRYLALLSLMCALISLLFGCVYIIRFGSMRKTYKAAEWALEAQKSKTSIWWNVWVLLAMPAIWLTWSIVLYIACIMSFIWRTNAQDTQTPPILSHVGLLLVRILLSSVLGLGILFGAMVLSTFSRYGEAMDRAWKRRIDGWMQEKKNTPAHGSYGPKGPPSHSAYWPRESAPPGPYGRAPTGPYGPAPGGPIPHGSYVPYAPSPYAPFAPMPGGEPGATAQYHNNYIPDPTMGWDTSNKGWTTPLFWLPGHSARAPVPGTPYYRMPSPVPGTPYNRTPSPDRSIENAVSPFIPSQSFLDSLDGGEESVSSPLYATQPDYLYNRTSTPRPEEDAIAPPPPQQATSGRSHFDPYSPRKAGLAVPPPPDLPPIPGSDDSHSSSEYFYASPASSFVMEDQDETPENRARFRSPLLSVETSNFGGSESPHSSPGRFVPHDTSVGRATSPFPSKETNLADDDTTPPAS